MSRRKRAFGNFLINYDFVPRQRQIDIELFFRHKFPILLKKLRKGLSRHGGIKFQLSLNVLLGKFKLDDGRYYEIKPWFQSNMVQLLTYQSIPDRLSYAKNIVLAFFDGFIHMGSGWFLKEINLLRLAVYKCNPFGGCSSISLPIPNKHSILNIRCSDQRCFVYSVLAAFRRCSNPTRYTSYLDLVPTLNLRGLSFPTKLSEIPKFEKNNNVTINVFGLFSREDLTVQELSAKNKFLPHPMYISTNFDANTCKHINLLLYKNHFMLIRNINSFVAPFYWKTSRYYCSKCFISFRKKILYQIHQRVNCTDKVYTGQTYQLPLIGSKVKFEQLGKQIKNHFIIYADFETMNSVLNKPKGKSTLTSRHELNAVGVVLLSKYSQYSRPPFTYIGKNVLKNFLGYIYQARAEISYIFDNISMPLDLNSKDIRRLSTQKSCYLCGILFSKPGVRRVIDHAHLGREGKGRDVNYACNRCNLTFSALQFHKFKIPIVMHNAMNYDLHFIVSNIHQYLRDESLHVISRSSEKFLSLFLDNFVFIDSYQFLPNSLSNLAELLVKKDIHDLKETKKYFKDEKVFSYAIRKGVMCYDYIDSWEKLEEMQLPPHSAFYNSLTEENISDSDYARALKVFKVFKCKTLRDYLKLYLIIDLLLLADVFESFREKSLDLYGLDPAKYLTAPSLSYDAMLKITKVKCDLLLDLDMYNFFEKGIRGGMTNVVKRYAKVHKEDEHIVYYDCNNLYGYSMIQPLPYGKFAWVDPSKYKGFDVTKIGDFDPVGYVLEVTLEYPSHLHDLHDMFPLAPEKLTIDFSQLSPYAKYVLKELRKGYKKSAGKLVSNLMTKEKYVVHYRTLKLYLQLGMKMIKIHRIVSFMQSRWMKPYIDFNNAKRKESTSDFDREFFKLMNNSTFGKCMENVKRRVKMVLTTSPSKCQSIINKPTFQSLHIFNPNFVALQYKKSVVHLDKPIYVGFSILDLSKMHMFDFHYNVMLKTFEPRSIQLLYTDTDSLIYFIVHERFRRILSRIRDYFDFSNFDKSDSLFFKENRKVLGKFKDETGGREIVEFVALKPKMYSFLLSSGENIKRVKGVKRYYVDRLMHSEFKKVLLRSSQLFATFNSIRSFKHNVYSFKETKLALSPFEDKRWLCSNGVHSLAYGNYKILLMDAEESSRGIKRKKGNREEIEVRLDQKKRRGSRLSL